MSIIIGEVVANISGNTRPFEQAMDGAKKTGENAATGIEQRFKRANESINAMGRTMSTRVTAPIVALGTALFATAVQASNVADEIDKMSIRSGVSRERLQELKFVTDQVGVSMSDVETAVDGLRRRLVQVDEGTGRTGTNLERLGISIRDASGEMRSMDDLFPEIIAGLAEIENETERSALAVDIFGRSASNLAPLIAQGADGIEALSARARELGLVMSDENIADMVAFKDAMSEIKDQAGAAGREIAMSILPIIKDDLIPFVQNTAIPAIQRFVKMFADMDDQTKRTAATILGIAAAGGPILLAVSGFNKLALAIRGVTIAMAANPYTAIGVGILALAVYAATAKSELDKLTDTIIDQMGIGDIVDADDAKTKIDDIVSRIRKLYDEQKRLEDLIKAQPIEFADTGLNKQLEEINTEILALQRVLIATARMRDELLDSPSTESSVSDAKKAVEDLTQAMEDVRPIRLIDPDAGFESVDLQPIIDQINELADIDFDFADKYFPPGSIADLREQISYLNELIMVSTDPERIAMFQDAIGELNGEIDRLTGGMSDFERAGARAAETLTRGIAGAVVHGNNLKSTLRDIIKQLASQALQQFLMLALTGGTSAGVGIAGGLLGRVFGVGDALIKSNGDVVQFHPNDNIMAWQNNMPMMGGSKSINLVVPVMIDGREVWTAVNNYEIDL